MSWHTVITALTSLAVSACAAISQPGSNPEQGPPWLVHCETEKSLALDIKSVPGLYPGRWNWAEDRSGQLLQLQGQLQQGFFLLQQVISESGENLPAEPAALRQACLATLERQGELSPPGLARVRAARDSGDLDVPILFPGDSPPVSRLVVFGDSLSDAGRLKHRMQVFPGKPYWLGRFSNGPVWPEYLEAATGLAVLNLAYGGASVARPVDFEDAGLISYIKEGGRYFVSGSLQDQVTDYNSDVVAGKLLHPDETAFVIWAGANDYISKEPISGLITTFLNEPESEAGYKPVAEETINGIAGQVEMLHAAGARRFLLLNLPDLGRTPVVLQNETYTSVKGRESDAGRRAELSRRLSALTDHHNHKLAEAVATLNQTLPGVEVLLVDSRRLTDSVYASQWFDGSGRDYDYGFSLAPLRRELRHRQWQLDLQQECYRGAYLGSFDDDDTCTDSATALFWDTIHPGTYSHCWQAFQVGLAMQSAGWLRAFEPADAYRDFCRGFPYRDGRG